MSVDHRHCRCGRAIRVEAKACPECFITDVTAELERLKAKDAKEGAA